MHNESRPIRPDLNRLRRHALSNQEAEDAVKYIKTLEAELAALREDAQAVVARFDGWQFIYPHPIARLRVALDPAADEEKTA